MLSARACVQFAGAAKLTADSSAFDGVCDIELATQKQSWDTFATAAAVAMTGDAAVATLWLCQCKAKKCFINETIRSRPSSFVEIKNSNNWQISRELRHEQQQNGFNMRK